MKLTIEELKGLNIETYLDWQTETVEKMRLAYLLIPIRTRELHEVIHNQFLWHMYYEQLKPENANLSRYAKYRELAIKREEELINEINSLDDDLEGVVVLADAENVLKVIKDKIDSKATKEQLTLQEAPTNSDKPFTIEDYNKLQASTRQYLKNGWQFTSKSLNYKYAETIDFTPIIGSIDDLMTIFRSHLDYDLSKFKRMQAINSNATAIVLKEATEKDFKYLDWVLNASICKEFFTNIEVASEFASLAYYSRVANQDISIDTVSNSPLKWIGKPAQLGYVMHLLESNGYIDAPKKKDGEINYSEFARTIAKAFQFEGNNDGYLAKSLNPESNNMENKNKDKFDIPHIKEIS